MKQAVLQHIKEQTGISFDLCQDFPDVNLFNGRPYFNILLKNAVYEGRDYLALERLVNTSSIIYEIQPNGLDRVAVVCYSSSDKPF